MADDQRDPIDREAERARVQFQDTNADPLAGEGEENVIGPTGESTRDHKIRSSQERPTEDIAAQRREVVEATHNPPPVPGTSGMGDKGELERLGANTDGEYDQLSDQERARLELLDEKRAQPAAGVIREDSEFMPTENTGDKAAPMNQVPRVDLD
jgi:hypothetical protein